jgi:nicotinamidase-related amidase
MTTGLHAPLGRTALHLVIDMQVIFDDHPDWGMADLRRILPQVLRLTEAHPDRTFCTRFIPADRAETALGIWQRYYRHWQSATLDRAGLGAVELVPELAGLPIAGLIDKPGFSAHSSPDLLPLLRQRDIDTLVLSGVETDVCVWATAMTAIDQGLRVVIAKDAVASGDPAGHQAILRLAAERFGLQIDLASVDEILAGWVL